MSDAERYGVLVDDRGRPKVYLAIATDDQPSVPLMEAAIWPDDLGARGRNSELIQTDERLQWWADFIESQVTDRLHLMPCPNTHRSWINPDQCPGCGAAI